MRSKSGFRLSCFGTSVSHFYRSRLSLAGHGYFLFAILFLPFQVALAESTIFKQHGDVVGDAFGNSVAGLGDVNSDGFPDYAIGAPEADPNGPSSGRVTVYSGRSGLPLYTVAGVASQSRLGWDIARLKDVSGDGIDDLIASSPTENVSGIETGVVRVLSGANGNVIFTFNGPRAPYCYTMVSFCPADEFGYSVDDAGDINNDGTNDIVIGASRPNATALEAGIGGSVYVYSGSNGSLIKEIRGEQSPFAESGDYFGFSVAGNRDVTGDGRPDIIVGAPFHIDGSTNSGSAFVFSGARIVGGGAITSIYKWDGNPFDLFGFDVELIDDVNSDGRADMAASAIQPEFDQPGKVFIYSGRNGQLLYTVAGDLGGDRFGASVKRATDIDNDGISDFIVGAVQVNNYSPGPGYVKIISGVDGSDITTTYGTNIWDQYGIAVGHVGDINLDGIQDFIVGAITYEDFIGTALDKGYSTVFSADPLMLSSPTFKTAVPSDGNQDFFLDAGAPFAGKNFLLLGTWTGITPGFSYNGVSIPLNLDPYFYLLVNNPGLLIANQSGVLDASGKAQAQLHLPAGAMVAMNQTLHHAFIIYEMQGGSIKLLKASNAVPVTVVP